MNNLEIIRNACIKANPSILELKFGCEVEYEGEKFGYIADGMAGLVTIWNLRCGAIHKSSSELEIIGRPPQLADVLLALGKKNSEDINFIFNTYNSKIEKIYTGKKVQYVAFNVHWDLKNDNLELQSENSIKFLAELLK